MQRRRMLISVTIRIAAYTTSSDLARNLGPPLRLADTVVHRSVVSGVRRQAELRWLRRCAPSSADT